MKKLLLSALCFFSLQMFAQVEIELLKPDTTGGQPLMKVLKERKSARTFDSKELSLQQLSNLIWAANGINRSNGKRTAPTAVNWQEIEVFVSLKQGIYYYNATKHKLLQVNVGDFRKEMGKQKFVGDAPVVMVFVANYASMKGASEKDKEFYSATDVGNVSQNVYLFCASEGLNTVVLGMVDKENVAKLLKLPAEQKVLLTQPVGFPK